MILSFVESRIPALTAIPGIKMGLANIAVVFALYRIGWREAGAVSLVRVAVAGMLFGSGVSILYSLAGAALSLAGMALMKRTGKFSPVSVSVTGGVLHNLGQIAVACFILGTNVIAYYLPFLILGGTVSGILIGTVSGIIINRTDIK